MNSNRVAVFILDLNGSTDTLQAVESVRYNSCTDVEIMIHINGSSPEHTKRIVQALSSMPDVRISKTDINLGYAGGNNHLLQNLLTEDDHPEYILFLNNDARLEKDTIATLISVMDANAKVGAVGPRILHNDTESIIAADGARTWKWIMQQSFRNAGKLADDCRITPPFAVPFVSGACMLVRADQFAALGGFDEKYFAYFEDWDLCLRMRAIGYRCLHVTAATAYHAGSVTTGKNSLIYHFLMTRNRYLMARKHLSMPVFVSLFLPYFLLSRVIYKMAVLLASNQRQGVRGILLGLAWLLAPVPARVRFWPITNT